MPTLNIGDGFDFTFTSKPTTRTKEPTTIQYRPPTLLDLASFDRSQLGSPESVANGRADFLVATIGSWNVDANGKPLEITKDTLLRIRDWDLILQWIEEIQGARQPK